MKFFLVIAAFFGGTMFHFYAINFNTLLTVPDSFAYIQMARGIRELSLEGLGTGWFGFLYSALLAPFLHLSLGEFVASQLVNLLLLNISALLLFLIGNRYLNFYYNFLLITIFFLSSPLLHYTTSVISENLFIPLFLFLIYLVHNFIETEKWYMPFVIGGVIGLMYLTRSEAFIYLGSLFIILVITIFMKFINIKELIRYMAGFMIGFFIAAAPYVYYLHSITGEWGLTNKGESNMRQALMRGTDVMDDVGFEKAVGELTEDKQHLKAGFVGGLKYEKGEGTISTLDFLLDDPKATFSRFISNQKKLYTEIFAKMLIGDSIKIYNTEGGSFYNNKYFYSMFFVPIILFAFGLFYFSISSNRIIFIIIIPFFITASIFFSIFFILERYFIVFLPFILLCTVYGIQEMFKNTEIVQSGKFILLGSILVLNGYLGSQYFIDNIDTHKYFLKRIAGDWVQDYHERNVGDKNPRIMERFPIVTFYAEAKERWLTPYTSNLQDIVQYAKYNKIQYLVVDTLDFKTYRPNLAGLLNTNKAYKGIEAIRSFDQYGQQIVIYKFTY